MAKPPEAKDMDAAYVELVAAGLVEQGVAQASVEGQPRRLFRLVD
jgi:hypothetical protein